MAFIRKFRITFIEVCHTYFSITPLHSRLNVNTSELWIALALVDPGQVSVRNVPSSERNVQVEFFLALIPFVPFQTHTLL